MRPTRVTFVANWLPFRGSRPAVRNFLPLRRPRPHYYVNVDNTGDGKYDVRYLFTFKTDPPPARLVPLRARRADHLAARQGPQHPAVRTTVTKETYRGGKIVSAKVLAKDLLTAPRQTSAPRPTPDYPATAAKAVESLPGGAKVFHRAAATIRSTPASAASSTRST